MYRFLRIVSLSLLLAAAAPAAERFGLDHVGRIVQLSDPRIAPDGRSVVVIVSRANFDENLYDVELVLVDVATGAPESADAPAGLETSMVYFRFRSGFPFAGGEQGTDFRASGRRRRSDADHESADGRGVLLVASGRRGFLSLLPGSIAMTLASRSSLWTRLPSGCNR